MKIVEIATGLFPDSATVVAGVETLRDGHEIERYDISGLDPVEEEKWSEVLRSILSADLVLTL